MYYLLPQSKGVLFAILLAPEWLDRKLSAVALGLQHAAFAPQSPAYFLGSTGLSRRGTAQVESATALAFPSGKLSRPFAWPRAA
jgi:hypothetical protein